MAPVWGARGIMYCLLYQAITRTLTYMYVIYVHIYIYICIFICIHVYIYIYMYICGPGRRQGGRGPAGKGAGRHHRAAGGDTKAVRC